MFLPAVGMGCSQGDAMCAQKDLLCPSDPPRPRQVPSPGPLWGLPKPQPGAHGWLWQRLSRLPTVGLWVQPERQALCIPLLFRPQAVYFLVYLRLCSRSGLAGDFLGHLAGLGLSHWPPAVPFPRHLPSSCPLQHQDLSHSPISIAAVPAAWQQAVLPCWGLAGGLDTVPLQMDQADCPWS